MNQWRQIESLFQEALRQPVGERDAWLREACAGDADLHREVASLLANHHDATGAEGWPAAAAQLIMKPVLLEPGQYLGTYQITSFLAAGGMGEVYRARDTKLKRDVAIKILPDEFSRDADRVSRFLREAEVLASLNHPNIAGIYDLQAANGLRFLVLELVEGETLAERIQRGSIPVEEALDIAKSICEALEAAHEKGMVHRDLKPANVKITPEGKVKVLDFGLAKVTETHSPSATLSNSPTMLSGTMGGMIIGTAAYMSPEQARGRAADQRSDVFAFGCVLFEMLTGQQAFQGEDVSDVLASVIKADVDLRLLPADLNPRLNEVVRRCLARDRKNRWHAIADVRLELETIIADPRGGRVLAADSPKHESLWKRALPIVAAIAVTAAIATAIVLRNSRPSLPLGVARFMVSLPEGQNFTNAGRHLITVSPDGANVVYVANNRLYLRSMADMQIRPIAGSESQQGITTPFFSPDSRWVGYFDITTQQLKKIAITGGHAVVICDSIENPFGASWASDDQIFVGQGPRGILRVSGSSGKPQPVVTVQPGEAAEGPQLLPGGFLLFSLAKGGGQNRWDAAHIVAQSMKSGKRNVVFEGGSDARYEPTGHIVYALGSTLFAFGFDVNTLQQTSGSSQVVENVARAPATGEANFSISSNGALVYIAENFGGFDPRDRVLSLVDRAGMRKSLPIPAGRYNYPRISPVDGNQLALTVNDATGQNIWIYDLTGSVSPRQLTFGGNNIDPVWTPDGQRIVFASNRNGDSSLFWQRADGTALADKLTKVDTDKQVQPESFSPDQKVLTFGIDPASRRAVLWALLPGSGQPPKVLIEFPKASATNSSFSPDGNWIAYGSTEETGQRQVYVQPFPTTGLKFRVPGTGSNHHPLWSPSKTEKRLFYMTDKEQGKGQIISVDFKTEGSRFIAGKPVPLPIDQIASNGPRAYDITPDGKSFIVMESPSSTDAAKASSESFNVILNWFEDLKQRVPVR